MTPLPCRVCWRVTLCEKTSCSESGSSVPRLLLAGESTGLGNISSSWFSHSGCHTVTIPNLHVHPSEQQSIEFSTERLSSPCSFHSGQGPQCCKHVLPILCSCPSNKSASGLFSNCREYRTSSWSAPTQADYTFPHSHPRAEGSEAAQLAEIYAKLEEIEADKAPARYLKFPLPSHFTFPFCYLFQLGSSTLLLGLQSFLLDWALPLKCSSSPPGE